MPEFSYQAINKSGEKLQGLLNSENLLLARQKLREDGLVPIEIQLRSRNSFLSSSLGGNLFKKGFSAKVLGQFCRQLSLILMSGVNILSGLEIMVQQNKDKKMQKEVNRILHEVQTGRTLSESMQGRDSLLPPLLAKMVTTGESSGNLEEVMRNMAELYEKEHRIKQKITAAAIYPIILIFVSVALILFFFNYLLPQITDLITSNGGELPLITQVVVAISYGLTNYWLIILGVITAVFLFLYSYFQTARGRMKKARIILKIPLLGSTIGHVVTMRFARTIYILTRSGLPFLQGLEQVKEILNNALAEKAVDYAIEGLQRGEVLSVNLLKANFFDPMAIQMFAVGEETGEMEKVLLEMANFYESEAEAGLAKMLAMVEPIMMLFIGSIVSIVIISVMLPMMELAGTIKR